MPKYAKQSISKQTKAEANKISNGIQRPGQTKEQTKLISQGIQKGIELYKRQQKSKARELDKKLKKASLPDLQPVNEATPANESGKKSWLPWILLGLSWAAFGIFWYLSKAA